MSSAQNHLRSSLSVVLGLVAFFGMLIVPIKVSVGAELASTDPAQFVRKTILPNGLTLLTLKDSTTPTVSFQTWVRVGSGDESKFTGLAHLFEHMMFRGSKNLPPEVHSQLIEARGGRVNAFTSRDVTVYFADVSSEHLPLVIELEAERLRFLDISPENLASERQVVLEERRLRTEDSPRGKAFEALMSLTFQAHAYRHPTIGWRSDIEALGVEECLDFFHDFYAPNNLVISISGDFDEEQTISQIREHFGPLKRNKAVRRNPTLEPGQEGQRRATVHASVRAPILAVGWHAPKAGHVDGPALDIVSEILTSGRSSRLYHRLIYTEQQALSVSGYYWELARSGLFFVFLRARPETSISKLESSLFAELEQLHRDGVNISELQKAKRNLEISLLRDLSTNHALASRIAGDVVTHGRIRLLDERINAIRGVTLEDVSRVVNKYLRANGRNVVQVVDLSKGDAS